MKRVLLSLAVLSVSFSLQAQTKMPSFAKLGYNKQLLYTSSKGEFEEFHDLTDVVEIGSALFNTKTNQMVGFVSEEKTDAEVSSATTAMSIDPHCEKYYWISPYAFALNNPVRYVDPDGMDVYRYDKKSGEMILYQQTEDNFDQVGKFKYDKKTDTYTLKTDKKGNAKTDINNIEKGILHDGMNFKNDNNVVDVGGEEQASLAGVENFILDFSNYIDKEMGGYYLSDKGSSDISHVYIGNTRNNTDQLAVGGFNLYSVRPDLVGNVDAKVDFHSHLSKFGDSDRLTPSSIGRGGGDMGHKARQLKINSLLKFRIITNPAAFNY
jgi:hypothetical protein